LKGLSWRGRRVGPTSHAVEHLGLIGALANDPRLLELASLPAGRVAAASREPWLITPIVWETDP
jgi:hypothetical protein